MATSIIKRPRSNACRIRSNACVPKTCHQSTWNVSQRCQHYEFMPSSSILIIFISLLGHFAELSVALTRVLSTSAPFTLVFIVQEPGGQETSPVPSSMMHSGRPSRETSSPFAAPSSSSGGMPCIVISCISCIAF